MFKTRRFVKIDKMINKFKNLISSVIIAIFVAMKISELIINQVYGDELIIYIASVLILFLFNYFIFYRIYRREKTASYCCKIILLNIFSFIFFIVWIIFNRSYIFIRDNIFDIYLVAALYLYITYKTIIIIKTKDDNTIGKKFLLYILRILIGIIVFYVLSLFIMFANNWFRHNIEDAFTMLSVVIVLFGLSIVQFFIIILLNKIWEKPNKIKSIILYVLYGLLLVLLFANDNMFINMIEDRYEYVKALNENIQDKNKSNKKRTTEYIENFEVVSDIKSAKEGQLIKFGKCFLKNDIPKKEDNYYLVLEKNGNELKLMSLYLIDKIDNDELKDYKFLEYLDNVFYENSFSENEKKMIVEKEYLGTKTHKVTIPSSNDIMNALCIDKNIIQGVANDMLLDKYIKGKITVINGVLVYPLVNTILKKDNIRTYGNDFDNRYEQDAYMRTKITDTSYDFIDQLAKNGMYLRPVITINVDK